MRRKAFVSPQTAYRYSGAGYCPVCKIKTDVPLDSHMMCHHLDLGQLWRCPVEWCAVWTGSVRECREHFHEVHSSSETINYERASRSIPAWSVPRDFWTMALRPDVSGIAVDVMLFHQSGRKLVHTYRVYRDPFPHPALREGRISKLISVANRAMVIAKLTKLRIAIPASGHIPGEVPSHCFPETSDIPCVPLVKRVTFAPVDTVTSVAVSPSPVEKVAISSPDAVLPSSQQCSQPPPPGFTPFEWPQADWSDQGDIQRDPGFKFVASWSAKIREEEMSSPPPLEPMSPDLGPPPLVPISPDDSLADQALPPARADAPVVEVTAAVESVIPVVINTARSGRRHQTRIQSCPRTNGGSPACGVAFHHNDITYTDQRILQRPSPGTMNHRTNCPVPRWRLAREGPFLNER